MNCWFFGNLGYCFRGFRCRYVHADCGVDGPCVSRELRHLSHFEHVDTTRWLRKCWIRGQQLPEDAIANSSILLTANNCISARRLQTLTATEWTSWVIERPDLRPILSGVCMELAAQTFQAHTIGPTNGLTEGPTDGLLALLPVHTVVATDVVVSCAVCQESAVTGEKLRTLPCLHRFHVDCIDKWLAMATTCPLCKTSARV
jgi:hypothetical protein